MNTLLSRSVGVVTNVPAILLNIKGVVFGLDHINLLLTVLISIMAIGWWFMKIYHQYLQTKKLKGEIKDAKD
jgi:hypothetical protein